MNRSYSSSSWRPRPTKRRALRSARSSSTTTSVRRVASRRVYSACTLALMPKLILHYHYHYHYYYATASVVANNDSFVFLLDLIPQRTAKKDSLIQTTLI